MWAKLIEMTADGRLSLVWVGIAFLLLCVVVEGVTTLSRRNRRVAGGQEQRKM